MRGGNRYRRLYTAESGPWVATAAAMRQHLSSATGSLANRSLGALSPTITIQDVLPAAVSSGNAYLLNDANWANYFRFLGGWRNATGSGPTRYFGRTVTQNGSTFLSPKTRLEFDANTSACCIRLQSINTAIRIAVDGQWVSLGLVPADALVKYVLIDWAGDKANRRYTIEAIGSTNFVGVYLPAGDTSGVTASSPAPKRHCIVGDSITYGSDATWLGDGFAGIVGDILDIRDTWQSGNPSSGYLFDNSGTRYTLRQRITDITNYGPWDMITIPFGINDRNYVGLTTEGLSAEVTACLDLIQAAHPAALITGVGPWDTYAPSAQASEWVTVRDAVRNAFTSRGRGVRFIDAAGVVYAQTNPAISPHPTNDGHVTLATWLAAALRTTWRL